MKGGDHEGAASDWPLPISVGVFAHDEAGSLRDSLDALLASRTRGVRIAEVLIVSSGSTDDTDVIAAEIEAQNPIVTLLRQARKEGKASAVNLFLSRARERCCALTNADTLLHEDAMEELCTPLLDPTIGMVGGHPVPVLPDDLAARFASDIFWEVHHRLCLRSPKMGEIVAFRRVFDALPDRDEAGADEDWIHGEVLRRGLRAAYAPGAVIYNRGPATLSDFLAHRRRMAVQHLVLRRRTGFRPASRSAWLLAAATADYLFDRPSALPAVAAAAALELVARNAAVFAHYVRGETCRDWAPLASSRGPTRAELERYLARR